MFHARAQFPIARTAPQPPRELHVLAETSASLDSPPACARASATACSSMAAEASVSASSSSSQPGGSRVVSFASPSASSEHAPSTRHASNSPASAGDATTGCYSHTCRAEGVRSGASRPVTSDMISFTATVIPASRAPDGANMESTDPQRRRQHRIHGLHRRQFKAESPRDSKQHQSHSNPPTRAFDHLRIQSATGGDPTMTPSLSTTDNSTRRTSTSASASKYGYMYSRGSIESAPPDLRARRSSATSRSRGWSRVRSVSGSQARSADAGVAASVATKPTTVWEAFAQTVTCCGDCLALQGCEERPRSRKRELPPAPTQDYAMPPSSVVMREANYTWTQQAERTRDVARALQQLGFSAGEGAVINAQASPLLHAVNLAVVALGGIVAHVRASWSAQELQQHILPCAHASILVLDALTSNFRETLETLDAQPEAERPPIRAVVLLGGSRDAEQELVELRASVNVLSGRDLCALGREAAQTTSFESLDSLASRVMPGQCCVMAFDYDARGRVRGAQLSHDNVLFTASALAQSFGPLSSQDRLVGYIPLHHVAAQVLELYLPLVTGLSMICAPSYRAPLVRVVAMHRPTLFFATPATWEHFSQQVFRAKGEVNAAVYRWAKTRATNNSLKLLFPGQAAGSKVGRKRRSLGYLLAKSLVLNSIKKKVGLESCAACFSVLAPLDFELERLFKTVDTPIFQLFGTPETSGFAALNFPHAWEYGSCGRALPNTTIRCDERSQETVLKGRNVFLGYVRSPQPQEEEEEEEEEDEDFDPSGCDADGWLRFCQRGFLTPNGFLRISDPRDFLILATGDWVPIRPFERTLLALQPELDRVVLVGDGRTFLSVLLFLKTSAVTSRSTAANKQGSGPPLDEDALKVSHAIGSSATTVGEAIRCQHWAVHFDAVLEELPMHVGVSGFRIRKWILMAADFSVESGELDPDTGDVCRRAVDRKYQALLDSLYS